ncbi:hypothetical protein EZS27_037940, partial [termite gut metagenome]
IPVVVNGPERAMNLNTSGNLKSNYFCHADFSTRATVDNSIKTCKQVTLELTCMMKGYRGQQTFMGLDGSIILRGPNDDYKDTHPIEITGLGDKVVMHTTNSFNLNEWMTLSFVVDCTQGTVENKYKLYINGVQETLIIDKQEETHSVVDLGSDGGRFEIGHASPYDWDWHAMQGIVSEARIWTVARTQQEISGNLCRLTETNPVGLLAHWDFTAGVETDYIQDISGGQYETNLTISLIGNNNLSPVQIPVGSFVEKGCPQ